MEVKVVKYSQVYCTYIFSKRVSDYEAVNYQACLGKSNNANCPKCKRCPDSNDAKLSLRRMQEIADSIRNRKRRYTPEVLKLHRILREMQVAKEFTTSSPKKPTRTTRNTYIETTAVKKGTLILYD